MAAWALEQADIRLRAREGACGQTSPVFVAFEPPIIAMGSDPGSRGVEGVKGDWLGHFVRSYDLHEAGFDQGCLGAPGVYPSRLVTSSWFLYETLHAVRADAQATVALDAIQGMRTGFDLSQAGWVGNLLSLVQNSWTRWKWEQLNRDIVEERKVVLRKLSEKDSLAEHIRNDHVPYRKGCPVCIQAQGRQRAHWRSGFPVVHSLSVDIAGPLISGLSWNVEASGRDLGKNYKYFLACAYAVPKEYVPGGPGDEDLAEYEPSECGTLDLEDTKDPLGTRLPVTRDDEEGLLRDIFELGGESEDAVLGLSAVSVRIKGKRPEPEVLSQGLSDGVEGAVALDAPGVGDSLEKPLDKVLGEGAPNALDAPASLKGHRTLFFGVPLRTKRGKEVLPQIQGVVHRLEAAGFPVQRYHADRAQELRSAALVAWLKHQGVHATWTAGESPAGNRAELAVQNLKGFVRKLLFIGKLGKEFWPLALAHASERNWTNFCESLGVPQPPLLPFGLRVHARRRTRTGFQAQWEARTVEGCYLGHAPNTPGGHLVLVKDGTTGLDKVLLTNTVYPLVETGSAVLKPKYKLVGKRSPPFAVRVVAADVLAPATFDPDARCTPGGESSLVSSSVREFPSCEFRGVSDDEDEDSGEGFLVEVGSGDGVMEEVIEDFGLGLRFLGRCELDECSEARIGLRALTEETASWIEELLEQRCFSDTQCREVLERGLGDLPMAKRPALKGKGRAVLLGLYGLGGFQGVSRASEANPEVTRYLNGFIKACCPEHVWTSLYVSKNTSMPVHRDLGNARGFDIGVRALGEFVGGGLWVEGESNLGSVCKVVGSGVKRFGTVYDIRSQAKVFSGERWHVSEDWEGEVRWIVSAFTPRKVEATTSDQWECLKGLGFPVAEVQAKLESMRLLKTCHAEELGSDAVPGEHSEWEVGLPLPVVDSTVCDGFVGCHKSTARLCRMLTDELCDAIVNIESVPVLAMQLRCAEQKREWLEGCLLSVAAPEGVGVRVLHTEIPLNSESAPQDQFLQTRAVGLAEARRELDKWKDPAREEVVSLETTNRAVDRVTVADVDKWAAEGLQVVQLPGKVVLTRKSGTGKRRCRAVCCGNYLPAEKLGLTREDLYASGAESLSVKVALTFAAGHPSWTGVTIDVKSAFLYAPIRSGSQESEERIVVKPPNFLVELGILGRNDRWWIRKALYGLPTSPRDWGRYRDQEFRQFRLRWNDVECGLPACANSFRRCVVVGLSCH